MARSPEKTSYRPEKCKPPATDSPTDSEVMAFGGFERPWHEPFLDDAMRTADIPAALSRADVGWGDYLRSRREHLVFMVACVELDLVVRHALLIRLESMAAAGDPKSIKLLNGGLAEIRRTLAVAGVSPDGPRGSVPNRRDQLHQVGSIAVPSGPCACCARGLNIQLTDSEGRWSSLMVRHEAMEGIEGIEDYPGYPNARILYGHIPRSGRVFPQIWEVGPDGHIKPEYLFPPLSGPTSKESWEGYYKRFPERRTSSFADALLDSELAFGVEPAPSVAHRYEMSVDEKGRQIYRLKPGDNGEIQADGG